MMGRNTFLGSLLLMGALGAQANLGDCEPPGASPTVPDGAVAAEEALAEASGEVRGFVARTQDYLACLEAREAELGADITARAQSEIVTTYNAAVETMQEVAENFNEQVRRFRERDDG
ncbi:MAG: hypothetical protein JJT88_02410 [Gammaproteobacteria bacterium]|nr:hypothetical protein [Gammaproteobacteria bacterium]